MTDDQILAEFRAADALLQGHFLLSSGRHSEYYLQCARVLMDTARAGRLAAALAAKLPRDLRQAIDVVVSPAMGGVIIGHEMGRALGKPAIFVERPTGTFELRRGFAIAPGQKVLMVEDVVTTGLSSREAMEAVRAAGGEVVAAVAQDALDKGLTPGAAEAAIEAAEANDRTVMVSVISAMGKEAVFSLMTGSLWQ